nr:MAG TPA: hypothetical protein [Caudoviricetes sp.]
MIAVTTLIKMIHAISSAFVHHGHFPFHPLHITTPPFFSCFTLRCYLIPYNVICQ